MPWRLKKRWLALLISAMAIGLGPRRGPAQAPSSAPVAVIKLNDTVNTVSAEYVTRGLAYAAQHQAGAVVLELNTPGGLDTAMRSIIQGIFASPVPVIGYVAPSGARSASAGFYILLSCDVAAMAPGTNTGAAHPVVLGGAQPDAIEAAKMQSDADAFIRSIATQRHRNVALAEKGVLQSQSFTSDEALAGNLINFIAPDLDALLTAVNHRTVTRLDGAQQTLNFNPGDQLAFAMSTREQVLDMDPSLAFGLLIIGALLIWAEFSHPGLRVPGIAGVILVVVALFALALLPISWAGAGLLILALVLFGLEARFHTHGALAIGGIISMALGGILLVDSPIPQMRVGVSIAIGAAIGFGAITFILVELVVRTHRHRVVTGAAGLIGESGLALTALALRGTVAVHGERWHAHALQPIPAGAAIRVRAVQGLQLEVEPESTQAQPAFAGAKPPTPPDGRLPPE